MKSMRHYRTADHPCGAANVCGVHQRSIQSMPSVATHVHCLVLEGADARRFAQAQFAGDVNTLAPGHWQWNAWLDAQGRVRALMQLADPGDGCLLALLRGGDAEQIRIALARFQLHAQVRVAAQAFDGCAEGAMAAGCIAMDAEEMVFGYGDRSLRLLPPGAGIDPDASNRWRLADIRAGWPTLPAGEAAFLPPALGLERLAAVAFDKGCYPGQEIAARLHFRGGHKLALFHVRGGASLEPPISVAAGGSGPVHVLDCVPCHNLNEALVVAHRSEARKINILDVSYDVVSRFDA